MKFGHPSISTPGLCKMAMLYKRLLSQQGRRGDTGLRPKSSQKQEEATRGTQLAFIKIHKHFKCTPNGIM